MAKATFVVVVNLRSWPPTRMGLSAVFNALRAVHWGTVVRDPSAWQLVVRALWSLRRCVGMRAA